MHRCETVSGGVYRVVSYSAGGGVAFNPPPSFLTPSLSSSLYQPGRRNYVFESLHRTRFAYASREGGKFTLYRRNFCNTLLNSRHCLCPTEPQAFQRCTNTYTYRGEPRDRRACVCVCACVWRVVRARERRSIKRETEGWGQNVQSDNYSLLKLHVALLLPAGRKAVPVQIERYRRVYNLHVTNSLSCRFCGVD